jgi:hypothetical protein
MHGNLVLLTVVFSVPLAHAQPANFSVPTTYFLGSGATVPHPYGRSSATPRAVVVGPDGDIWGAGVALGDGLPIQDPDKRAFAAGLCLAAPSRIRFSPSRRPAPTCSPSAWRRTVRALDS